MRPDTVIGRDLLQILEEQDADRAAEAVATSAEAVTASAGAVAAVAAEAQKELAQ